MLCMYVCMYVYVCMNMGRNNFESCKIVEAHDDMPAGSDPVVPL